jgi:2-C-methyl-D-erythritol 4-phosphate cytidylyltransferase
VAIPSVDTILVGDKDGFLVSTPERARLWACQTPQTFRVGVIREAHRQARAQGFTATDDASLVRRVGGRVKLVLGTPLNFKITTPFDLAMAQLVLEEGLT